MLHPFFLALIFTFSIALSLLSETYKGSFTKPFLNRENPITPQPQPRSNMVLFSTLFSNIPSKIASVVPVGVKTFSDFSEDFISGEKDALEKIDQRLMEYSFLWK